jgi:hypothetical protein
MMCAGFKDASSPTVWESTVWLIFGSVPCHTQRYNKGVGQKDWAKCTFVRF